MVTPTQKMKRSSDERHTQTHGSVIEMFQRSLMSFSIRREHVCEEDICDR